MKRIAAALLVGLSTIEFDARAGGLFTTDRGVRPLGRGGAFVAGADDLGAIWYNPAGLADAGTSILVDASWLAYSADFTRRTQVADSAGTLRTIEFDSVHASSPFIPLPTIAGSYAFGKKKELTVAAGIHTPYTSLPSWPAAVDGKPAPSRYSLVSLSGSALVVTGGYLSYKPIESIRIGGGIEALVGTFKSQVVFSASPGDRLLGAPEDPQYDALSRLSVGPIIAPSACFGMIALPTEKLRVGVSAQLPFWIHAPATVDVRLPTAAPFDRARQGGNEATVTFRLPPIARAGVEYRTNLGETAAVRVELAYVREFWSLHDTIDIRSKNVQLLDVSGFPSPFGVPPITIPEGFQDSNSFRLGGEAFLKNGVDLRSGLSFETSAIPTEWVTSRTYDASKVIASIGASFHASEHVRLDAMAALAFFASTTVDPAEAASPRVNPVRGNPTATESVNGGDYSAHALVLGLGGNYRF